MALNPQVIGGSMPHGIANWGGKLETSQATYAEGENPKYVPFEVKIEYRDTERKPKYVIINSCASRYGDDFTGAVGSVLYVDEFEFVY